MFKTSTKARLFFLSLIALLFLSSCAGDNDREARKLAKSDQQIKQDITMHLAANPSLFSEVDIDVSKARVLLSGEVDEPEARVKAIEIAWEAPAAKEVVSEIEIRNMAAYHNFAEDIVIVAQGRAKIRNDKKIDFRHYTIDSINGTVYLLGTPANKQELARVDYILSRVANVKKVINRISALPASYSLK